MLEDDQEFLPPKEEEVPASLAKKWDEQEKREGLMRCRGCQKQILAASSFCAYCGEPVGVSNRLWTATVAAGLLIILLILGIRMLGRL